MSIIVLILVDSAVSVLPLACTILNGRVRSKPNALFNIPNLIPKPFSERSRLTYNTFTLFDVGVTIPCLPLSKHTANKSENQLLPVPGAAKRIVPASSSMKGSTSQGKGVGSIPCVNVTSTELDHFS